MIRHRVFGKDRNVKLAARRQDAEDFANRVWEANEENSIINICECDHPWATEITVWYYAEREVE